MKSRGSKAPYIISDVYDVLPWLNITAGLRLTLFNPLGPESVYTYIPGYAERQPVILTTPCNMQAVRRSNGISSPTSALAVNIRTDADGTVKIAFNQMHQNLFLLNNTIAISPNSQWIMADYYLPPARSNQVSAGVFRTFPGLGWEASLELYYKTTVNYPEFIDGADFLNNPLVETTVLPGNQKAYGIEFLLRQKRSSAGRMAGVYLFPVDCHR